MRIENIGKKTNPLIIKSSTWRKWTKTKRAEWAFPETNDNLGGYNVEVIPGKDKLVMNKHESFGKVYLYLHESR